MKLHQLRYLAAVAQSGLNITAAAQKLHTSQPGVSKQIKLLEDELGFQIFVREGRNLTRITPAGHQVIERALRILQEAQSIRSLSTELRDEGKGSLSIGTTHTQARYVLPDVIREFRGRYPQVRLNLHQGTSEQIAEMVAGDRIDCAIATGYEQLFEDLTLLPCYRWHRTVIVPRGHPLADGARLSFKALAAYPQDPDLVAVDDAHMFPAHTTWIGFRRGTLLRKYMYEFAQLLAPHLDRRLVDRAHRAGSAAEVAGLFADTVLPER